jgi:hypothetical protein
LRTDFHAGGAATAQIGIDGDFCHVWIMDKKENICPCPYKEPVRKSLPTNSHPARRDNKGDESRGYLFGAKPGFHITCCYYKDIMSVLFSEKKK